MRISRNTGTWIRTLALAGLAAVVAGCGSSGGGAEPVAAPSVRLDPPAAKTVVGQVDVVDGAALRAARAPDAGATITLDDGATEWPLDEHGRFELTEIADGDHSLFVISAAGTQVEVPFRMLDGKGLNLGMVKTRNGQLDEITGFDGYRYGFVDEDGDGVNDLCRDVDGNGECDEGSKYAHYTYLMEKGWGDQDRDRVNDRFRDRDGDCINDLDGTPAGWGFGFVDANGDGINDNFRDADGDGICDRTGMPYRVGANWVDEDGDGVNDNFRDANGDGICDVTGEPYVAMPGWVDLDGDGVNDKFLDADGDGICDNTGLSYGHGFGFVDEDGDGINDRCCDADGNGQCDPGTQYAQHHYRHGFLGPHVDRDGDNEPDGTGNSLREGFGWVDDDGDGDNDTYVDEDRDGVNDQTGEDYTNGYQQDADWEAPAEGRPVEWPPSDDDFTRPPAARGVKGAVVLQGQQTPPQGQTGGATISLDNVPGSWPLDSHGRFELTGILDGDHSLFITSASGVVIEVPFRMLGGKGLNLGEVTVENGEVLEMTGFDGYRPGFVDDDEDGLNDNCVDEEGDGICDEGCRYANYSYLMNWGFRDDDGDGMNDRFRDRDGDGMNDLDGSPNGWGFGFVDEDEDGVNDNCADADGNGICDQTWMAYRVRARWQDDDHDGVNDTFADANGDGICDVTGEPYVAMPGWVDLDRDGVNDKFQDADGDGICDNTGLSYGNGFGFVDEDGDGVNDRCCDADGDGQCDPGSTYAQHHYRYGFLGPHVDRDGDGEVDGAGDNLRAGLGWVDEDGDGNNDNTAAAGWNGAPAQPGDSGPQGP